MELLCILLDNIVVISSAIHTLSLEVDCDALIYQRANLKVLVQPCSRFYNSLSLEVSRLAGTRGGAD